VLKVTGTLDSLKSSTFKAGPVVPMNLPGRLTFQTLLLSAFQPTDHCWRGNFFESPSVVSCLVIATVQTIAYTFRCPSHLVVQAAFACPLLPTTRTPSQSERVYTQQI